MTHQRQCKLTVIRKAYFEDLAKDYAPVSITCPCQKFEEGQTFILDQNGPQGYWHLMGGTFCSEAWAAISNYVDTILQGGTFQTDRKENYRIACCPSGIRPVIFKIELLEDE